jgi:hypothetical protein
MKAVESILNLLRTRTSLRRQITTTSNRQAAIVLHDPTSPQNTELLDHLTKLQESLEHVEEKLVQKEDELMIHSSMTRLDLEKIKSSQWYDALIRARAFYHRMVSALVGRKFAITQRIEDYRSHILGKCKFH